MPKHHRLLALSTATLTLAGCLADVPADELEAASEASGEDTSGEAPEPEPAPESLTTGEHDPADPAPLADERSCEPGEVETCKYGGPAKSAGVGTCAAAVRVCGDDGEWGACAGEVLPRAEDCRTLQDEDCDGRVACDGKIEWVRAFGEVEGGEPGNASVNAVSVDQAGHAWMTGDYRQSLVIGEQVRDVGEDIGLFVAELDGQSLPHYFFGDEQKGAFGRSMAIADDGKGRVAISAFHQKAIALHDDAPTYTVEDYDVAAVVGAMTTAGEYAWSRALTPTEWGGVMLPGLAFAPTGHLWAGGFIQSDVLDDGVLTLTGHGGSDAALVKLTTDGEVAWAGSFGDEEYQDIFDIAVDAAGDVWLTGRFSGAMHFDGGSLHAVIDDTHGDMFVVKLDAAGKWKWGRAYGDTERQHFVEIELDAQGDAWLFGEYAGTVKNLGDKTLSGDGLVAAKMASNGEVLWARGWPCEGYCGLTQAGVDGAGQAVVGVYIAPNATTTINEQPLFNASDEYASVVVKLDREGLTVWTPEPFPGYAYPDAGPRGEVVVAGNFREKVSLASGAFHLDAGDDDEDIYVAHLRP